MIAKPSVWGAWRFVSLLMFVISMGCGGRASPPSLTQCSDSEICRCQRANDCPDTLRCIDGLCQSPNVITGTRPFATLCDLDVQCASGRCIEAGDGSYGRCTDPCEDACPDGWRCAADPVDPTVGICIEDQVRLCAECDTAADCGVAGDGVCVDGRCGQDCSRAPCPIGYRCAEVGSGVRQCLPEGGRCICDVQGVGRAIACQRAGCWGQRLCLPGGLAACDAPFPSTETCNGVDDDCDGLVDDEDPEVDVAGLPMSPVYPACRIGEADNCRGEWRCDEATWMCEPAAPVSETCDGLDNDCDGVVDQPFIDAQGRYLTAEHCGGCNRNCGELLENLAVTSDGTVEPTAFACADRDGEPTCVPLTCRPGYAPFPEGAPVACVAVPSVQCMACVEDSDCIFSAHRCVQLDGDGAPSCLQGCGTDAPAPGCTGQVGEPGCCPDGSICEQRGTALVCVPVGAGCDCTAERLGAQRPCQRPGDDGALCAGAQTCIPGPNGPAWSICDADEVTREVCNGLDDDCDGLVDDAFIDTLGSGTYDTAEHCGQCFRSCLTLPNAVGRCAVDASGPACAIDTCTDGRVVGGGLCRSDADCGAGLVCDPSSFQCTRRCSAGCVGNQTCVDGFCAPGCVTDIDCVGLGAEVSCQAGRCGINYTYVDRDEAVSNGCECPVVEGATEDPPEVYSVYPEAGAAFVDRNCDGVDGVVARSLFVRAGAVGGSGTQTAPFGSIARAIAAFNPARHDTILVAGGLYDERLILTEGVALFGGYSPDFTDRDVATRPSIIQPARPVSASAARAAVTVTDITAATVAGFVIRAWDAGGASQSGAAGDNSVAILTAGVGTAVVFRNNEIVAGRGGNGAPGSPGQSGASGGNGGDGRGARECRTPGCQNETLTGGAAGSNLACSGAAGIRGGRSQGGVDPQEYGAPFGLNGEGGDNARYNNSSDPAFSNLCKYDCSVRGDQVGQPARSGQGGRDGQGGTGCSVESGRLTSSGWLPFSATGGQSGTDGQGGGGGGAGGNVVNENLPGCTIGNRVGDLGSSGGGGGAGGCGGQQGGAGGGGGGSIALLVLRPVGAGPTVVGNRIARGVGGDGGPGGAGGAGGIGGQGGEGGVALPPAWCAGDAGKGGRGGDGGAGGGGGGGCGGVSYGIAGSGLDASGLRSANEFSVVLGGRGGRGGEGGRSPSSGAASRGSEGDSDAVHVFP